MDVAERRSSEQSDYKDTGNREGAGQDQSKVPPARAFLAFLLLLVINYAIVHAFFPGPSAPAAISYTAFREELAKGNVEAVHVRGETIEGRFRSEIVWPRPQETRERGRSPTQVLLRAEPRKVTDFTTIIPPFVDPGLETELLNKDVEIRAEPIRTETSPLATLFWSFGPALLLIGLYVWMFRRAAREGAGMFGAFGLGRSRARRFDKEKDTNITFEDVAGIDEAEHELVEIVDFLKNPDKYTRLGGTMPKGVLLVGPPGTGKTLLARAVAGEAGVPFFSMSGSEFVEMIVGVGAARVRDLFKEAREHAPAIIFIDEIDSIGRARGQTVIGVAAEHEQTLNQILAEMDGFSSRESVVVLAATNQPDILDKALLRPGRFDRRVVVNLPDSAGREAIFKVHTRKVPLAEDVDLAALARSTPGVSGADIRNLVNEAALLAARNERTQVHHQDFLDALEKIVLGPARPIILTDEDRRRIAYHEGGHAILGIVVPGADPVHRVTIVPRGQALGVTYQAPSADRYNYPEDYLRARIIGMLGGRAAEEVVYGSRTTGAENDIEQATALARQMVTRWGMSDKLGMVQLAPRTNDWIGSGGMLVPRPYSEETAKLVDAEVQRIIGECHDQARRLLEKHRGALDALVAALMERETLDQQEILEVTRLPPAPALPGEFPPPRREAPTQPVAEGAAASPR